MRLKFSDLFEGQGYAARCAELSGAEVEIAGWIVESHDGSGMLLVEDQGVCPDCAPEPVPTIALPGLKMDHGQLVRLRGTLSYGFAIDAAGTGSMLRLENARIATGLPT